MRGRFRAHGRNPADVQELSEARRDEHGPDEKPEERAGPPISDFRSPIPDPKPRHL